MDDLLPELVFEILKHLSFPELGAAFCVCTHWSSYNSEAFFSELIQLRELTDPAPSETVSKKWAFLSKMPLPIKETQEDPENADEEEHKFTGMGCSPCFGSYGYYEGEWLDGKMHNFGTCHYKNQAGPFVSRYDGSWDQGIRKGKGKLTWKTGDEIDYYEGDFDDLFDGQGEFHWRHGDSYKGQWAKGAKSGYGAFVWHAGDSYEGHWVNDLKSGQGHLKWKNGNEFNGIWKSELKEEGEMFEAVSGRRFSSKQIDQVLKPEIVHPIIQVCMQKNLCTSVATGTKCYFQYLWQATTSSDRVHGFCIVCKEHCVPRNRYKLRDPDQFYLGGNFYCDCGAGRLSGKCYSRPDH